MRARHGNDPLDLGDPDGAIPEVSRTSVRAGTRHLSAIGGGPEGLREKETTEPRTSPSLRTRPSLFVFHWQPGPSPMTSFELPRRGRGQRKRLPSIRWMEVLEERVLLADGINPQPGPQLQATAGVPLINVTVA